MTLKRGDNGEPVKALQRDLNKLGSLLKIDGDFGSGTESAVVHAREVLRLPEPPEADATLMGALAALPDPFPPLTTPGVTFIGREEVSSPKLYRTLYSRPTWPGGESGVTIGIGYDLRFSDEAKLRADWGDLVPAAVLAQLVPVLRKQGSAALRQSVAGVEIPLPAAISVFVKRSLPEYLAEARGPYPTLDQLSPARRTALVSLVFNRGAGLTGERRREMKRIQELLATGQVDAVADQFDSMTRLWNPATAGGLIERRHREAVLWRSGFAALQLD